MSKSCKKFILTACMIAFCFVFVKISCDTAYAVVTDDPSLDPGTGNGYNVLFTPNFNARYGQIATASGLSALLDSISAADHVLGYYTNNTSGWKDDFMGNYIVCIKYYSSDVGYGIYVKNERHSGWLHCGNISSGFYMIHCPVENFEPSLLNKIIGYIDQVEGRLARTVGDTVYTVADSTYHTWQTLKDMSGTIEKIAGRLLNYTDDGVAHTVAESAYWGYQYQKYTYNRLSDVISAIENIGVASVTLDGVQLNVDSSNINFWNNKSYCCGYRTDAADNPYETFAIPYDAATAIVARLNTDYVGQGLTVLNRDGTTYTRYVRSATILEDGYIRVRLTNGYNYYLCDNVNVLYVVDMNSNYGSRIESLLTEKMDLTNNLLTDKLTSIESVLSNLNSGVTSTVEEVTNIEISVDNDARNVFFVEDENGDRSIVDLSKDGVSVFGKLLNFLYKAMFKDALTDSDVGIESLYDFYFDESEGGDVWAS